MTSRDRVLRTLAIGVSLALLIAPAIWNGFPLLEWDTGGYLARWYEGTLAVSRAAPYGLMLSLSGPFAFWPLLFIQAALTVWIVALTLRAHALEGRPVLLVGIIAALSIGTTLPWLTSILLTDIFCGLGILALYLLLLHDKKLSRWERISLIGLTAVAAATHSATFAVLAALTVIAAGVSLVTRQRIAARSLGHAAFTLVLGAFLVLATNYIVAKKVAWTPGGFSLSFGRMLQDGIVKKYLDEHCPNAGLKLCPYKDQLPQDADVWFWGDGLFDQLGRFAGLDEEMETIAVACIINYPGMQIQSAIVATARQLVDVSSGDGVVNMLWHTYGTIEHYTPQLLPAILSARQQRIGISFKNINKIHYPLALLSMALLPVLIGLAYASKLPAEIGELAAFCVLALLLNAFICGVASNPHNRYGARVVWLAGLTTMLALARSGQRYRQSQAKRSLTMILNRESIDFIS